MSITINQIQFDPASPADNQRVGSFIISASGNVIDDTAGALDVAVTNEVTVSATDLDIRDLTHVSDSVKIGDGTDFLEVNADGSLNVNATVSSTVADDAADAGNPIKVGGRGVSTASALSALSAANDRFDLLGDLYRRLFINESHNIAHQITQDDVTSTAAEVLATPLAGRKTVIIQNLGDKEVYVGHSGSVTTADGVMIPKNASMEFKFGEALDIFMIAPSGTQDVRFLEAA